MNKSCFSDNARKVNFMNEWLTPLWNRPERWMGRFGDIRKTSIKLAESLRETNIRESQISSS